MTCLCSERIPRLPSPSLGVPGPAFPGRESRLYAILSLAKRSGCLLDGCGGRPWEVSSTRADETTVWFVVVVLEVEVAKAM